MDTRVRHELCNGDEVEVSAGRRGGKCERRGRPLPSRTTCCSFSLFCSTANADDVVLAGHGIWTTMVYDSMASIT